MAITGGKNEHRECVYCRNSFYRRDVLVVLSKKTDPEGKPLEMQRTVRYTCDKCGQDVFEVKE